MKKFTALLSVVILILSLPGYAGTFSGDLVLLPEGCQQTQSRICKLKGMLTYKSSNNGLVWQTDEWKDGNGESGTTDGASIPKWAQPIIGDQYDESYLKAAIVHDHYCYNENQVRTWRDTHRMFYDALIDLGINKVKAKAMYFAVYWKGPKWVNLVPGEYCGFNCIKQAIPSAMRWEGDSYGSEGFDEQLSRVSNIIEKNPEVDLDELEAIARTLDSDSFFYQHGNAYSPSGPKDPKALPAM
ncbi:hypothetical protein A9Q99_14510 [Gammaproteobacteria bacterium 45_16_T64]|nr:hypothetical protein A9Q99_14510 [Gammaproteobacteria bacterium 45_16_T64]